MTVRGESVEPRHQYVRLAVALLALALPSCAAIENIDVSGLDPKTANIVKGVKAASRIGTASMPISDEKEIQIGQVVAARIAATYGIDDNPALTKYINLIGQALVQQSGRTEIPYHFAILDSDKVNAFAAPGGYIFLTRGMILKAKDEAELAGVIAHEIAHVTERQVVEGIRKANITAAVAKTGGDYLEVGGELFENVANAASDMLMRGLDRDDELEADRLGTALAARVGYAPGGLKRFLETLKEMKEAQAAAEKEKQAKTKNVKPDVFATHPKPADRIAAVTQFMKAEGLSEDAGPTVPDRFRTRTAAITR